MVLEERGKGSTVRGKGRKGRGDALDSGVVGREEREAVQTTVEDLEERLRGRLVGGRVKVVDLDLAQGSAGVGERRVVDGDRLRERLGDSEDVIDRVDGDVLVCGRVRDNGVVPRRLVLRWA